LSEHHQFLWLREIRRIVKPGGCVILTIHGEKTFYENPASFALPFVERFGIFDGISDDALGANLDRYYRATFHSRSYIKENWSKFFDILDVIPVSNAFLQDYVVLRRP
jgi:hypothetical protein